MEGGGTIFTGLEKLPADTDGLTRAALDALLRLPDVRRVGLALTEGGGRRLRFTASDRDHGVAVDWCHIDAYDDVPLTTVVRTGTPVIGSLVDLDSRYAELVERQRTQSVQALAALPLIGAGPPLGGVVLFFGRLQAFDTQQRAELARHAADLAGVLRRAQAADPRPSLAFAELPVAPGARVTHTVVESDPRAVGEARRHLRRHLAKWGVDDDAVDTAVLCLSELVTNAVIHSRSPSEMRAVLEEGTLTIAVRDRGADGPVRGAPDDRLDPMRVHGRGLQIVAALADRWGSELDSEGATVWFVLDA